MPHLHIGVNVGLYLESVAFLVINNARCLLHKVADLTQSLCQCVLCDIGLNAKIKVSREPRLLEVCLPKSVAALEHQKVLEGSDGIDARKYPAVNVVALNVRHVDF